MVFTKNNKLISGGRDNLILVWDYSDESKNAKMISGYDLFRRKFSETNDSETIKEESTYDLVNSKKGINLLKYNHKSNVVAVTTFEFLLSFFSI